MKLIIVQQGPALHYEYVHTYLDSVLSHADRHAWNAFADLLPVQQILKIYLPAEQFTPDFCSDIRSRVAGIFRNGKWDDLRKTQNDIIRSLPHQHLKILAYIPHHSATEITEIFEGKFGYYTIREYIQDIYDLTGHRGKTALLQFLSGTHIQPIPNKNRAQGRS